jgi:hypothetical protein
MALMFKNTYSPGYYKKLHGFVHKNYRKHLAIADFKSIIKTPLQVTGLKIRKALTCFYLFPVVLLSATALKKLEKHDKQSGQPY